MTPLANKIRRLHVEINVVSCHSKFALYEVINCRTIVRVHLGTYIENVNISFYSHGSFKLFHFLHCND